MRTLVRKAAASAAVAAVAVTGFGLAASAPAAADPGDVIIDENFDDNQLPEGWHAHSGNWRVENGELVVTAGGINRLTFGEHLDNYRFEATVRFDAAANDARWAGLVLDISPDGEVPWWQAAFRVKSDANNGIEFANRTAGSTWNVPFVAAAPEAIGIGNEAHVAVEVQGTTAKWYLNDKLVLRGQIGRSDAGVLGSSPTVPARSSGGRKPTTRSWNSPLRNLSPSPSPRFRP